MTIETAYTQHCGKGGWSQQDALLLGTQLVQSRDRFIGHQSVGDGRWLSAVADGISCSPHSQIVSRYVLELLAREFAQSHFELNTRLIRRIHGRLCDRYARGRTRGAATTIAAVLCSEEHCQVVNVGDSRIYRIDAEGNWDRLSYDHTVLSGLLEAGLADPEQTYSQIYNSLEHCLIADDEEDDFSVHCTQVTFEAGDTLVLCTDGVHDCLGESVLQSLYLPEAHLTQQVSNYRTAILAADAPDNFSLVMAKKAVSFLG